jgi:hypothetical protein
MEAFRARADAPKAISDVYYRDFIRDPLGVVEQVYASFGIELSSAARQAMENFMRQNQQGKHGAHEYSAQDYGLDPAAIRTRFARYIAARAIPVQA